jgi:hypothetical protein
MFEVKAFCFLHVLAYVITQKMSPSPPWIENIPLCFEVTAKITASIFYQCSLSLIFKASGISEIFGNW